MEKVVGMCEEETPGRQEVIRLDLTGSSGKSKRQLDSLLEVDQPITFRYSGVWSMNQRCQE